jgi:hypothetical protein
MNPVVIHVYVFWDLKFTNWLYGSMIELYEICVEMKHKSY